MSEDLWPEFLMRTLANIAEPSGAGRTRVRFHGEVYLLIGNMTNGGAIATPEQFESGECPHAHLYPDGRVLRFGEQVGTREDLEVLP